MNISITSKCLLLAMCNPSWPLSSTLFSLLLQFSCWVVSDSLRPHGLQHTRLPSPCLSPRVCSNGLMSVKLVMPSKHLILCCPLFHLPSVFPSIKVSFTELALHIRWPKCWRFSFSFSPSNEYSGLISFRIDWVDLLAVQGTLKSLLQYHNLKASILWLWAFFVVQLSYSYMTTGKTIRVASFAYLRLWYFSLQSWFQIVLHSAWHFTWCTLHRS